MMKSFQHLLLLSSPVPILSFSFTTSTISIGGLHRELSKQHLLFSSSEDDYSPSDVDDASPVYDDIVEVADTNIKKDDLIQSMLRISSSSDRGQHATQSEKQNIESTIRSLEMSNQDTSPTLNSNIYGTWELLYASSQLFKSSPFFMCGRAVCKTEEEAMRYNWFCDMHRAALAISNIGKVRQIISSEGRLTSEFEVKVGSIPFLSDFTPFAYSGGLPITIDGAIVSTADVTATSDGKGWEIFMDQVEIKGSNIPLLRQILDQGVALKSRDLGDFLEQNIESYENPKPIFETTYLDENLRISRDQDNNIFVYGKVSDVSDPTNYASIDSDLGITKLLGGLNDNFFKFYI